MTNEPITTEVAETVIQIRDDVQNDVRRLAILINHHAFVLDGLKGELRKLLMLVHGIDIGQSNVIVDPEAMVIARQPQKPA